MRTTAKARSATRCGQRSTKPLPLIKLAREITPKWYTGLSAVHGRIQAGMASAGDIAPDNDMSGGVMKKVASCACCADFVIVATAVPSPIPQSRQSADETAISGRLPLNGTLK